MPGILVIAPHADDEVLGVGGTLARAAAEGTETTVAVMTGPGGGAHPIWPNSLWDEIRGECRSANLDVLGVSRVLFNDDLPAAMLDATPGYVINRALTKIVQEVAPDEIYIPFAHDLQKDHQAIAHACFLALRGYLEPGRRVRRVLAYEVLSETHLRSAYLYAPFEPNVYVDVTGFLDKKLDAMSRYRSQVQPDNLPRSLRSLEALARLRGSAIGVDHAEAFLLLRETLRLSQPN